MARRTQTANNNMSFGSPAVLDNLTTFSFCTWVKFATLAVTRYVVSKVLSPNADTGIRFLWVFVTGPVVGTLVYTTGISTTWGDSRAAVGTFPINIWHHYAATYDGAGDRLVRIYKNGVEVTYNLQQAASAAQADDSANSLMLWQPWAGGPQWDGWLHDTRIWKNRVLTDVEILNVMRGWRIHHNDVVLHALMLADGQAAEPDYSNEQNTATMTGTGFSVQEVPEGWNVEDYAELNKDVATEEARIRRMWLQGGSSFLQAGRLKTGLRV